MSDYISVIIPIYNTEKYLAQCIESVIRQSYNKLEIILIDDGSKDSSGKICDDYASRDDRIIVRHTEERGVTASRKEGLGLSKGNYICFVDGDDCLDQEYIERLYSAAIIENSEVVACGHIELYEDGSRIKKFNGYRAGVYDCGIEGPVQQTMYPTTHSYDFNLHGALWGKLFRRDVIYEDFMELDNRAVRSEDLTLVMATIINSQRLTILDECLYYYRIRSNSLCRRTEPMYYERINCLYLFFKKLFQNKPHNIMMERMADILIIEEIMKATHNFFPFFTDIISNFYIPNINDFLGKKIVLYGAGNVGKDFKKQLNAEKNIDVIIWVDSAPKDDIEVLSPKEIKDYDYDCILIAVKAEVMADEIRQSLVDLGIDNRKIIWEEPISWKEEYLKHAFNRYVSSTIS